MDLLAAVDPRALGLEVILHLFVKTTVLLGAASLLAALLRKSSAARRHAIWGLSLTFLCLLPLLGAVMPALEWDLASWLPAGIATGSPGTDLETAEAPSPAPGAWPFAAAGSASPRAEAAPLPLEPNDRSLSARTPVQTTSTAVLWGMGLCLWLGGAILFLARLLSGVASIAVITRGARPMGMASAGDEPGAVWSAIADLARSAGISRRVRVLESPRVHVPVNWGLWRPVVLLPLEARAWSAERLRTVLLHELAHIRRWDYLEHLVAQVARATHWVNPLVWRALRRLGLEQEKACDDLVLASGTRPCEYAEHLVEIAKAFERGPAARLGAVAMVESSGLKSRIRAILGRGLDRRPLSPRASGAIGLSLGAIVLPLAALEPSGEQDGQGPGARIVSEVLREAPAPVRRARTRGGPILEEPRASVELPSDLAPPGAPLARESAIRESVRGSASRAPLEVRVEAARDFPRARRVLVSFEAEDGALTPPMESGWDGNASGNRFVHVPDGPGNDRGGPGRAVHSFHVPDDGRYVVWGRVLAPEKHDNTFFVSVDGGPAVMWYAPGPGAEGTARKWTWDRVSARLSGTEDSIDPVLFDLTQGDHTLVFWNREDGTCLDAVVITNDLGHRPRGKTPAHPPGRPASIWLEAEDGDTIAPMKRMEHAGASGGECVTSEREAASRKEPHPDGRSTHTFHVEEPGTYVAWARVMAPAGDADSFWVRVDAGPWFKWKGIEVGRSWRWVPLYEEYDSDAPLELNLDAGEHTLALAPREGGVMLDRIVITNDRTMRPETVD